MMSTTILAALVKDGGRIAALVAGAVNNTLPASLVIGYIAVALAGALSFAVLVGFVLCDSCTFPRVWLLLLLLLLPRPPEYPVYLF